MTNAPSIETAPSYSPDGSQIVFESDRLGGQQLYIMGGGRRRAAADLGRGRALWHPGLVAAGRLHRLHQAESGCFHIGVMRTDGSEERLLTSSFLDEGPTWSPNGRVIMFTRQDPGGEPSLWSVDISGRNLKRITAGTSASDPAWSPLLP